MAWQDDLERYKRDPRAAQQEIERAKRVWQEKNSKGDKAGADAANRWANQVRQAAGISNSDSRYGNDPRTYTGGSSRDPIRQQPPVFQPPMMPTQQGGGASAQLLQALMGMMGGGGGGGLSSDQTRQYRTLAEERAAQERKQYEYQLQMLEAQRQAQLGNYDLGMNQLNNDRAAAQRQFMMNMIQMNNQRSAESAALEAMMKQAGMNRDLGLQGVDSSTEEAKAALEDRSFQDYLESRQNIANRGMSGTGIAADADTRLALAKQGNMANIMRDAALQKSKVQNAYTSATDQAATNRSNMERQYGMNLMGLLGSMADQSAQFGNRSQQLVMNRGNVLAQFDPQFRSLQDQMGRIDAKRYEEEMINKATSAQNESQLERMKILSGLIGTMLPYDRATANQMMDNQLSYDKLNSGNMNDWLSRLQNQMQWEGDNALKQNQFQQNQLLEWSKLLGIDPQGNPTLGGREFQLKQQQAAQLQQYRMAGLINEQQYQQAMLQLQYAKFGEDQMQNDLGRQYNIIQSIDREMAQLQDAISKGGSNPALEQRLNQLQGQKIYMMNNYSGMPQNNQMPPINGPWLPGKYNDPNPKW